VEYLAECYEQDRKIRTELGSKCKKCEFKCTVGGDLAGSRIGNFSQESTPSRWGRRIEDTGLNYGNHGFLDLGGHILVGSLKIPNIGRQCTGTDELIRSVGLFSSKDLREDLESPLSIQDRSLASEIFRRC